MTYINIHQLRKLPTLEGKSDSHRLRCLEIGFGYTIHESINLRGAIEAAAEHGKVTLVITERDCDHVQVTYTETLLRWEVRQYLEKVYANAEGPVSWQAIRPSSKMFDLPPPRDYILEAFEDGHPHSVYC